MAPFASTGARRAATVAGGARPLHAAASIPSNAPLLPWPPPHPSSTAIMNPLLSVRVGQTYSDINNALRTRLNKAGYLSTCYFSIWNTSGFALMTPLEEIDNLGRPIQTSRRFATDKQASIFWIDYIHDLFMGEDGRYRVLLFVAADAPFSPGDYNAESTDVDRWERSCSLGLDASAARMRVTHRTTVTLLVYEFTMSKGRVRELIQNVDHPLPVGMHIASVVGRR